MSGSIRLVSANVIQGTPALPSEGVTSLDSSDFIHGGRYGTVILPEFINVYWKSIARIMGGIVLESTKDRPVPSGGWAATSIFGFANVTYDTETIHTRVLIPNLARPYLPLIEGNLDDALHRYHTQLIHTTNEALEIAESPYRLEPLPAQHP